MSKARLPRQNSRKATRSPPPKEHDDLVEQISKRILLLAERQAQLKRIAQLRDAYRAAAKIKIPVYGRQQSVDHGNFDA